MALARWQGRGPLLLHWKRHQHSCTLALASWNVAVTLVFALNLASAVDTTSHQKTPPGAIRLDTWQQQQNTRSLLQLGRPWVDNGGSWPPGFTDLDRALETQRIFKSVAAERNKTAAAMQNMDAAWTDWLQTYNVTFNATADATYRRTVFNFNLQRAYQLNQIAGPEVAFGVNYFSILTPEEFLANYTGDAQNDEGITVTPDDPQRVSTPAADYLATLATSNSIADNSTSSNSTNSTATPAAGVAGSTGRSTPGSTSGTFSIDSSSSSSTIGGGGQLPGAVPGAGVYTASGFSSGGARRLQQRQWRRQQWQQQQWQEFEGRQEELELLEQYWEHWRQGGQQQQQQQKGLWQQFLLFTGLKGLVVSRYSNSRSSDVAAMPMSFDVTYGHQQSSISSQRRLQQLITPSSSYPGAPPAFCSKQVAFPYQYILPFKSVDWLRGRVVRPVQTMSGKCNNSFAYVAAALAESTMLIEGYNGTAQDISEAHIMECFPGGSCTRGGYVHVVLNYLACNGVAAAGSSSSKQYGAYPSSAVDAGTPGQCAAGKYLPVRTGVSGWAFVPNNEYAFSQALSKTPIKVSVDASVLQNYRAGYLGCNLLSSTANHAMLAVGYNYQVRAGAPPPGSSANYTFFAGPSYWMLKNSWGLQGSVDGYVYVRKGCEQATPLGMMLNRGVMPLRNQSESYRIGQLQCTNDTNTNQGCGQDLLLRLAGYCAGVDDYLPAGLNTNCSCSCIPR